MTKRLTASHFDGERTWRGVEWAELHTDDPREYIGWVPYGAVIAFKAGRISLADLRRIARPEPPAGMQRASEVQP